MEKKKNSCQLGNLLKAYRDVPKLCQIIHFRKYGSISLVTNIWMGDGSRYNMDLQIIGPVHIIIIHIGNNYVQIRLDTTVLHTYL